MRGRHAGHPHTLTLFLLAPVVLDRLEDLPVPPGRRRRQCWLTTPSTATNQQNRGNGLAGYNGWPTSEKLEALRDAWFLATNLATQKALARELQLQAWQDVPTLPLGAYYQPVAYKADLTGMLTGLPMFTNLRRIS